MSQLATDGSGDGDGVVYREALNKTVPDHTNYGEMTVSELRAVVAFEVGRRTVRQTPLDMDTLNSIHAHITGHFAIQPRVIGSGRSPGPGRLRDCVSYVAEFEDYPYGCGRPFRHAELTSLVIKLRSEPDRRGWTPDGE